ncbi:MAG: UDP-N-acetylenolpyruvoylglucosamine reductase, partial [Candidatus Hydrothermota bacterium]
NAGAFGREISELINWLEFIDMDGNVIKLERDELRFGYRWSEFPQKGILLRVSLHLVESEPSKSMDLMTQFLKRRRKTQPLGKTAGCVFKNPPNAQPAGYLLDKAGLKGFRVGGAKFSEIHANFVINAGGATAHDVVKLMQIGKNRVFDKFGVNLEPEIVMVGVEL